MSRGLARLCLGAALAGGAALVVRSRRHGPPPAPAVGAVLTAASVPVLARRDPRLFWWLLAAQQVRTLTAIASHDHVHMGIWAEANDTEDYHAAGERIGELLREGRLGDAVHVCETYPVDTLTRGPRGTNLIRFLTGGIYAALGPSRRNGFVVFSWLGFWGLYCFLRAFETAVPAGSARTYRRLLFLSPSLLFWTANIGKEAWMVFSLGVSALGGAKALTPGSRRQGLALGALGTALTLIGRPRVPRMRAALDDMARHTHMGGSGFRPPALSSPGQAAAAAGTVLFRPHVFEAHNRQAQAAAAESAALLMLTLARARWIAAAAARTPRRPYIGVAMACTGGLIFVLSGVANFGTLARQRSPLLPFYFVMLSVPPARR